MLRKRWEEKGSDSQTDWRHIANRSVISGEEYADQPYVVVLNDGRSWTSLVALIHEPGGSRVIKHSRACIKVWRTREGKCLLWHYFSGDKGFRNRNPAWRSAGVEDREGKLRYLPVRGWLPN